jgi:hypothetical protein
MLKTTNQGNNAWQRHEHIANRTRQGYSSVQAIGVSILLRANILKRDRSETGAQARTAAGFTCRTFAGMMRYDRNGVVDDAPDPVPGHLLFQHIVEKQEDDFQLMLFVIAGTPVEHPDNLPTT